MEHKYTTNNFLVRNAIIGIHELLECDYNSFLETIRENKIFQEQLFVASRSLYESLQKYYSGDSMKRKKSTNYQNLYINIISVARSAQHHLVYLVKLQ